MLPALALGIPLAAQTGLGIWQAIQAGKAKQDRPYMPIPPEELEKLSMAREQYSQTQNPYASMQRQELSSNVSQGMDALERGSTSGTDILGGVGQLNKQQEQGILGIGKQNIDYKQQAGKTLTQALSDMQNARQMQWNYNIGQPYERAMATRSAMLGSAQQNILGSLWGGANMAYAMNQGGLGKTYNPANDMRSGAGLNETRTNQTLTNDSQFPTLRSNWQVPMIENRNMGVQGDYIPMDWNNFNQG